MYSYYFGAAVFIEKFNCDFHFATKRRIVCFEFINFHNTCVRHQLDETAM